MTENEMTQYARKAFPLFRRPENNKAELSRDVAYAVGAQASRVHWDKAQLSTWLQTAYGSVWVRESDLVCGLDLKEVRDALFRGYDARSPSK